MQFSLAQTFYVDPNAVNGVDDIYVTNVQLYFRQKPTVTNTIAAAGQIAPGCSVAIGLCTANNVPDPTNLVADALCVLTFDQINTSTNAQTPTIFSFPSLVPLQTGKYYAIFIHFDSPEYVLWYNLQGDDLVGTTTKSPGVSQYVGAFYQLGSSGTLTESPQEDLTFVLNIAQFTANTMTVELINASYEFLVYDTLANNYYGGEYIYQDYGGFPNGSLSSNVTFFGNGTVNVSTNASIITGLNTNFGDSVKGFVAGDFIVVTDGTVTNTSIMTIVNVSNSTYMTTTAPCAFSNTATHYKKTAVAAVYDVQYANATMILDASVSNATVLFSNSSLKTVSIAAGGSGYANTDYFTVSGSSASINAVANISTNSTGGIITVNITNAGYGFTGGVGTLTLFAQNGASSNGTGATLTPKVGAVLRGEQSGSFCNLNAFFDYKIDNFTPEILVKMPDIAISNAYCNFANAAHYVSNTNEFQVTIDQDINAPFDCRVLGTSVEVMTPNAQLANIDGVYKSSYIKINLTATQTNTYLFSSPYVYQEKLDIVGFVNEINNSDFGEVTDNGNCQSKYLSAPVTIANGQLAQGFEAYVVTWVPSGTSVEVLARLYNPNDPDAFTSKSWTPLVMTTGNGVISSSVNPNNTVSQTWSLPFYPKSAFTCPGTCTVATGCTVLTTTSSLTSNLVAGDLIKVYSAIPGFASQEYFVTSVTGVNSTAVNISSSTTNTSVLGTGKLIDNLTNIHTAYQDIQNSNVVTYWNSGMVPYTEISEFAVKVLLLGTQSYIVPFCTSISAVAIA